MIIFLQQTNIQAMSPKHLIYSLGISSILISCNGPIDKAQNSLMETSKQDLALALQERDQLLALVKEVSAGMEQIKKIENIMTVSEDNAGINADRQQQILGDLEAVRRTLHTRKKLLDNLEARLSDSTINNKELKETISAFRSQLDAQLAEILSQHLTSANEHIEVLSHAVDSLNSTVDNVTDELNTAQETTVQLENRLNTCYYAVASKSQLKEHGILESGFLRKTKLMKGDFDMDFFNTGDKRELRLLHLNSAKARLLTNHPENSFEITNDSTGMVLHILNLDRFWSLSNFLVIEND